MSPPSKGNEEAIADAAEPVSLSAMAAVLEKLGPPEEYGHEPPAVPSSPAGKSVADCFQSAWETYKGNVLTLLLAGLIFHVLSLVSLLILLGPLLGGVCRMFLNASARPDKKVELADLFGGFDHFWSLLLAYVIMMPAVLLGFSFLIVPGFLLFTIWLYVPFFIVTRDEGAIEALGSSYRLVRQDLGWNAVVALVLLGLGAVPGLLRQNGLVLSIVIAPLAWLVWGYAFVRQSSAAIPSAAAPPPQWPI